MGDGVPGVDVEQFYQTISDIREKLTVITVRLEKLDDHNRRLEAMERRAEEIERLLVQALESTKSAHKRLDTVTKLGYWLLTAIGSGVILAVVNFGIKGGFANP